MDPNVALVDIRQLIEIVQDPNVNAAGKITAGRRLAEKFQALDEWLSRGGFPPRDWPVAPPAQSTSLSDLERELTGNPWRQ